MERSEAHWSDDPLVSVVMPVRNEARYLAQTLRAVLDQDYPPELLEVLIVDGESDDGTLTAIRPLLADGRARVLRNPRRIQAAAMNIGLREARGAIVVRVDGHTLIAREYVRACVEALRERGAEVVGGAMRPIGETRWGRAIAAAGGSPFAVPSAFHVSARDQYTDTVYMGAWRRATLEAIGGFDERFAINEDYELNYRIRRAGGRVFLSQTICSRYIGRQSLRAVARQYLHYGVGKTRTLYKYPGSVRLRQLVAPAFVVFLACGAPVGLALPPGVTALWLLILGVYLLLALMFAARAARPSSLQWRIALVFFVMHVMWGCGFWCGLATGWRRDRRATRTLQAAQSTARSL